MLFKSLNILFICAFFVTSLNIPGVQAAEMVIPSIPKPGTLVSLSPAFTPAYLKGIIIHSENALKFDFLVHKGDGDLDETQKREEYHKLIKYFLAALTVTDKDQWVNLSPFEKNRIIESNFGKTEMGRDLLAQDYLLKQITSSLMYPESGLGKTFWDKVFEKAYKEYGNTNIPVNTFNKVWIVPDQAVIYESGNTAYVVKSHLKVMLEEDYLSLEKHSPSIVIPAKAGIQGTDKSHTVTAKIIRDVILPEIEKEVNEGKNFAMLRQVYSGMLLATWYKKALKGSILGKIYADKSKVKGVEQSDPKTNEAIYQRYLAAFKKGVYNYVKEDEDKHTNQVIPRKYFAGGFANAALINRKKVSGSALFGAATPVLSSLLLVGALLSTAPAEGAEQNIPRASGQTIVAAVSTSPLQAQFFIAGFSSIETLEGLAATSRKIPDLTLMGEWNRIPMPQKRNAEYTFASNGRNIIVKPGDPIRMRSTPSIFGRSIAPLPVRGEVVGVRAWQEGNAYHVSIYISANLQSTILTFNGVTPARTNPAQIATFKFVKNTEKQLDNAMRSRRSTLSPELVLLQVMAVLIGGLLYITLAWVSVLEFSEQLRMNAEAVDRIVQQYDFPSDITQQMINAGINSPWKLLIQLISMASIDSDGRGAKLSPATFERLIVMLGEAPLDQDDLKTLENFVSSKSYADRNRVAGWRILALQTRGRGYENLREVWAKILSEEATPSNLMIKAIAAKETPNPAQVSPDNYGGIDMNAANLAMTIKRDGKGVPLPLAQQDMAQLSRIQGFVAEILEIKPATALPIFSQL